MKRKKENMLRLMRKNIYLFLIQNSVLKSAF